MNQNIAIDFIKNAQAAGLPQEQAEQFLVENLPGYKTAAQQFDDVITHILTEAGVEKTADTSSYAAGFLYEAVNKGVDDNSAIEIAKQACDAQRKAGNFPPIPNNMKKANDQSTPDSYAVSAYAAGFMKQAQAFGYTEGQSLDLLKLAMRKQADFPPLPPNTEVNWEQLASDKAQKNQLAREEAQLQREEAPARENFEKNVDQEPGAWFGHKQDVERSNSALGSPHVSSLAKYLTPEGLAMIGGGAAIGGGAGAMMGGKHSKHSKRNALLGALLGGGAGAGADYYMHKGASASTRPSITPGSNEAEFYADQEAENFPNGSLVSEADRMKGSYSAAAGAPAAQASPNPLAQYLTPEGLAMIGGGAALGGGAGAMLGGKEHRTRNAILGALLGGGAGAGADYLHANPEMYKSLLGGQ